MTPDEKRAYDRAYHAKRSPAKKSHKVELQAIRRRGIASAVYEYKLGLACACGEIHPAALDFHHRDDDKEINVADAANRSWSKKRLFAELAKCDVICANCHRKLHFAERAANPAALTTLIQQR